jgi:aminoethylphosphonate catabolism LysR family transcriptional regulator
MFHVQLRAFHAVATAGGFTRAAARLNVTQPTLSAQVRELEEHFGVGLLHRRGRRVEPTALGHQLMAVTRRLFDVEAEAIELLAAARRLEAGNLALGADSPHQIMPAIAAFGRRYPGIAVSLSIGNSDQVLRDLLDYRIDVGVLAEPPDDPRLVIVQLRRDPLVALTPRDHPWIRKGAVALAELADAHVIMREPGSFTRELFERALRAARLELGATMEIDSREAVREAVATGLGVSVISAAEIGADPRLAAVQIEGVELAMTEALVRLAERRPSRPVQAFLEQVEAEAASKER